jgi:hypothetical protein
MRYWKTRLRYRLKTIYYKVFYGFDMGLTGGTMMPQTGRGKYVSVYQKGKIIQIIDESGVHGEIRIIPFQPNHGVMVERWRDGKMYARNHMGIDQLQKGIIYASNVEQLTKK